VANPSASFEGSEIWRQKLSKIAGHDNQYLRLVYESLISVYLALLVISAEESRGSSWASRIQTFYVSHRYPGAPRGSDDNYRFYVVIFLSVWISAAVIFVCMRLMARCSFTSGVLLNIFGIVAVAGFPFACLYHDHGALFFLEVELAIAGLCLVLYTHQKWPVSAPLNVFLLIGHYALWTFVCGEGLWAGVLLFWPGWHWIHQIDPKFIYSFLGLAASLSWGAYVKQLGPSQQRLGEPALKPS
jgi:hypothetical protein